MNKHNQKRFTERPMYLFLLVLSIATIVAFQAWRTLFNNFAVDVVSLDSIGVGSIQAIREIPGFLALLVIYVLLIIKEHRLAAVSVLVTGMGISLTGIFPSLTGLIATTLLMSFGFHYFETVNQSLTLQYFSKVETPHVFARIRRFSSLASILVGITLWVSTKYLPFEANYILFGLVAVVAGAWALRRNPVNHDLPVQHKHMVIKKEYWLYYCLTLLSGARRQIFVVFAVFLMVKNFEFGVTTVAFLFAFNNLVNFFALPYIARLLNHIGERHFLMAEYVGMVLVFVAYAFADSPVVIAVLYVLDNILFHFSMGIKTYFQKIADPKDIAPSMGVSFTINHIIAVVVPFVGGIIWQFDYRLPFLLGASIALVSLALCFRLPLKGELNE